jgi:hypothetical protein
MSNYTSITYFYMHLQVITPNYKHYMHDTTDPIFFEKVGVPSRRAAARWQRCEGPQRQPASAADVRLRVPVR